MKRDWENSELHTRNMDVQGSGEDSNANENHQGKGDILKLMKAFVSAQASVRETPAY